MLWAVASDSLDIAEMFTGRYQAMHVPSRDLCIATVLHATISIQNVTISPTILMYLMMAT
jgi:hypothetical protein